MATPPSIILTSAKHDSAWTFSGQPTLSLVCDLDDCGMPQVSLMESGVVLRRWSDPLAALEWMASPQAFAGPDQRWVGYLSYDIGRWFERLPRRAMDDLNLPPFAFVRMDAKLPPSPAKTTPRPSAPTAQSANPVASTFAKAEYLDAVRAAKAYIEAGDIFQVNLSQRLQTDCSMPAEELFARIQRDHPADFGALLDFGNFAIVSNSPELFFKVEPETAAGQPGKHRGRRILNRPIKGTRPRLPGMDVELRESLKDQAELNMIVDLQRNDLGRVCQIGSVQVTEPRVIETHPTVYHGVATVEGRLRSEVGFVDLLRAVFPCGSITGCPKIRSMEIIDELEPVRRGPYCGAIGYVAANGAMEFSVAIRIVVLKNGKAYIPVGGGIVSDSDPLSEYEETWVKAKAMMSAIGSQP